MADFQLVNQDAVETLGSEIIVLIGPQLVAPTILDERLLTIGNIRTDFRTVGNVQMSDITLTITNKFGSFDTNYNDVREAQWIILVDSTEFYRGFSDKTNFEFNRKNKTVTVRLITGQINDKDLDFTIVQPTVAEFIEDILIRTFGITTVNFDLGFAYQVNGTDAFLLDSDSGPNDILITMQGPLDSGQLTANRFTQLMAIIGLDYVIWKGEGHVYYKDQFFSETRVIASSDDEVIALNEFRDYRQDDFFNQVTIQARRFDAGFGFKIDKLWTRSSNEVLNYSGDNILPHWETGLGNWLGGGASTAFVEAILTQGSDDYFWAKLRTFFGETSFVDDMQVEITTDLTLEIGDTIVGSFAHFNLTGATKLQVKVGDDGIFIDVPLEKFEVINPQSEPTSTQAFPLAEFEYIVDDIAGGSNLFFRFLQNEYFGDYAIPITRGFGSGGTYEITLSKPHGLISADANDIDISVFQTGTSADIGTTTVSNVLDDFTLRFTAFVGDVSWDNQGFITIHEGGISISAISEQGAAGEVRVDTAKNHKLEVGDLVLIDNVPVAAYNGLQTVITVNTVTRFRYNDGVVGRAASSGGNSFKNANIRQFYFNDVLIFKKEVEPVTEIIDYTIDFNHLNNPRFEPFEKGGPGFIGSQFNEQVVNELLGKAITVYQNRNNTQFIRRALIQVARIDINPFSRIELDIINYLVDQFGFDLEKGLTTMELIEE